LNDKPNLDKRLAIPCTTNFAKLGLFKLLMKLHENNFNCLIGIYTEQFVVNDKVRKISDDVIRKSLIIDQASPKSSLRRNTYVLKENKDAQTSKGTLQGQQFKSVASQYRERSIATEIRHSTSLIKSEKAALKQKCTKSHNVDKPIYQHTSSIHSGEYHQIPGEDENYGVDKSYDKDRNTCSIQTDKYKYFIDSCSNSMAVSHVPGIGPAGSKELRKLGLATVGELNTFVDQMEQSHQNVQQWFIKTLKISNVNACECNHALKEVRNKLNREKYN
ncbi:hypothetical protein GJ496_002580, partial [Pomphorhynchus laevis]